MKSGDQREPRSDTRKLSERDPGEPSEFARSQEEMLRDAEDINARLKQPIWGPIVGLLLSVLFWMWAFWDEGE